MDLRLATMVLEFAALLVTILVQNPELRALEAYLCFDLVTTIVMEYLSADRRWITGQMYDVTYRCILISGCIILCYVVRESMGLIVRFSGRHYCQMLTVSAAAALIVHCLCLYPARWPHSTLEITWQGADLTLLILGFCCLYGLMYGWNARLCVLAVWLICKGACYLSAAWYPVWPIIAWLNCTAFTCWALLPWLTRERDLR